MNGAGGRREPPQARDLRLERAASHLDDPLIGELIAATLYERLAGLPEASVAPLVAVQVRAKLASMAAGHPLAAAELLLADVQGDADEVVGYLVVDRTGDGLHLVDLAVRPALRGRGIGGRALSRLCEEADAAQLALTLSAWSDDPVVGWYERHGFVRSDAVVAADAGAAGPGYLSLRRPPRSVALDTSECSGETSTSSSIAQ